MLIRLANPLRFLLERWIQKGVFGQLLLMASLVALVAVAGGLVAHAATDAFGNAPDAIWWAFLRLTDPGYLGDDEGATLRTISTVVTVAGYVLFMGSMIAIMTQWLSRTMQTLESGVTPISMRDHIVILGWTNRTPEIVLRLLSGRGRLRRFLQSRDARKLRIVVLAEDAGAERRLDLREHLGEYWNESQIFLRAGSSLQVDHLERLDLARASVVVIPGADFELGGSEMSDTRVVKTLMTVAGLLRGRGAEERPHLVAEIFDPRKVQLARNTVECKVEVVASNRIISRLIFQSVRHSGLAPVLFGLFSHREGNALYLREVPEAVGFSIRELAQAFDDAVVLGFLHRDGDARELVLDPGSQETVRSGDLLISLAHAYDDIEPTRAPTHAEHPVQARAAGEARPAEYEILVLGWSHKIAALVAELNESGERYALTIMSRMETGERDDWLRRIALDPEHVTFRNVLGDYSIEADLTSVDPGAFDQILLLASDWMDSSEAADARTVLGQAQLTAMLRGCDDPPEILIELLDPDNAQLFTERSDIVLVTPRVLSHLLAHVALRPELHSVYDLLFGVSGSEIGSRSAASLGLAGRSVTFHEIQDAAFALGLAALGVQTAEGPELNPDRGRGFALTETDRVIVLAV